MEMGANICSLALKVKIDMPALKIISILSDG
jgi:hypothetical protein